MQTKAGSPAELRPRLQAAGGELCKIVVELTAKRQAAEDDWARVAGAKRALEDLRQLVLRRQQQR